MTKGPNSFFIAPDSEFIVEGSISSSNDATGLYTSKTIAATANSGSMSSFMIGTPESNTTYRLRIQDSGSNNSGTYIYRPTTSSGSDDSLIWYGEPDRRYMWDIHNPLLKNYTQVLNYSSSSPPAGYFWEDSLRNENANAIQGVYFSVLNKEFLYVASFDLLVPKLFVSSRSISNYEQNWSSSTEVATLDYTEFANVLNINIIDSNKRGLETSYEPTFSICEHIDGKLKLVVKFNDEIDIYESSNGTSFTLIAKNILSRFRDKRFVSHLKVASSGPYLKIAFVNNESTIKNQTQRFLGTMTSSDGGASWDYTDVAKHKNDGGAGIIVRSTNNALGSQNYTYDLCGMSDGSGRFILANGQSLIDDNIKDGRVEKEIGTIPYINFSSDVSSGAADPFYISCYVASGNSKLEEKVNLAVQNRGLSAKPFLATNNDWVWLVVAGCRTDAGSGFERNGYDSPGQFVKSSTGYLIENNISDFSRFNISPNENSMFYMKIESDLNNEKWSPLGVENYNVPDVSGYFNGTLGENLKSGRTTGAMGGYFFIPSSGNLYSCGPYMAFCSIAWPLSNDSIEELDNLEFDYGSFNKFAQYYRFSGWMLRPPYINWGLNPLANNRLDMIEKFVHQEKGIISIAEFNYIFGKPKGVGTNGNQLTMWGQRRIGAAFSSLREDSLEFKHIISSGISNECNFYYYRTPTVCDKRTWTIGAGQRVGSVSTGAATTNPNDTDVRYPMFPISMVVTDAEDAPYSSWVQSKRREESYPDGSCIQFVFGGVTNGSVSRNSVGIKINSFTKNLQTPNGISSDGYLYEFFLRIAQNELALYNTSAAPVTSYDRESGAVLVKSMSLGASFGSSDFANSWWEGKLSFLPHREGANVFVSIVFSVRLLGTDTWQDSTIANKKFVSLGKEVTNTSSAYEFLGFQGISFGIFPDSAATLNRKIKFRSVKVCQGSDMQHASMIRNATMTTKLPPVINLIRGRNLAPNPAYIGTGQSVSWGGIGGKFNDIFDTKIKSSYNVENTIKISSPRFEYRTKGDNTSDIKASKAEIVYELPNTTRTSNSLVGYPLNHTGLAIINTNVEKIKIEYDDNSSFSSPYVVGEKSLKLINARVEVSGSNNKIKVKYDGESSFRNLNNTKYTSLDDTSYYLKFTTSSTGTLQNKSYKIIKSFGPNLLLDIPDNVLDGTLCPAGTTIEIYSDRMISTHALADSTYMRITLTGHLGTNDYIKMGSLIAGTSFDMDRVPINWDHSVNVTGNVTEFNSRSGVRWGYREGPSVRTFTGEIIGDVFDEERENIKNIAEQATHFNIHPVAMVFDSGRGSAFESGSDSTAKAYIDPTNILYGTINSELQMVNEGWRYDSENAEWKVVGNLQLTIIEVV